MSEDLVRKYACHLETLKSDKKNPGLFQPQNPSADAGGLTREYVLRITSVS